MHLKLHWTTFYQYIIAYGLLLYGIDIIGVFNSTLYISERGTFAKFLLSVFFSSDFAICEIRNFNHLYLLEHFIAYDIYFSLNQMYIHTYEQCG